MPNHKYEVRGTDEQGDVHAFRTSNRESADEMLKMMTKDLQEAEIVEL